MNLKAILAAAPQPPRTLGQAGGELRQVEVVQPDPDLGVGAQLRASGRFGDGDQAFVEKRARADRLTDDQLLVAALPTGVAQRAQRVRPV